MDKNKLLKIVTLLGVLAGVAIMIFGFIVLDSYDGYWADTSVSFGGDFYSYSYKATAKAANNVDDLGEMMAQAMGFLLISIGLTDACFFGVKFVGLLPEKKEEATAEVTEEAADPEDALPAAEV